MFPLVLRLLSVYLAIKLNYNINCLTVPGAGQMHGCCHTKCIIFGQITLIYHFRVATAQVKSGAVHMYEVRSQLVNSLTQPAITLLITKIVSRMFGFGVQREYAWRTRLRNMYT